MAIDNGFHDAVFSMDGFTSMKKSIFYVYQSGDLELEESRRQLLALMFNHPERAFYYFIPKGQGIDGGMEQLRGAVNFDVMDACFYAHPNFQNDYVQIVPKKASFEWEQQLIREGCEFVRFTLTLTERQRRRMVATEALEIEKGLKEAAPLVQVNPKFWWFTFDGKQILKRALALLAQFQKRRRS